MTEKKPVEKRFRVSQGVLTEGGIVAFLFALSHDHAVERFKAKFGDKFQEGVPVDVHVLPE